MNPSSTARERLLVEVQSNADLVQRLEQEHLRLVEAAAESNADDEHDPEGATLAFERQQLAALLDQARVAGAEARAALERLDAGDYGRCESCGGPIGVERLEARPAARTCIECAS